ncbi:hypothetical protein H257_17518 [Aphanomyces astaci]|uniref:Uncharacterized protein n=1 Tax=Aphanomyces astaci TaxID=112090 RepID=W4FGJ3_APHAT|nr:hypothetical protein H257_17518 [Aphanomyces astaci]ETV65878.1 hypothetical protein H257_17518 [Aphanomyces astaci]|eukprot:XP_009844631.1 hypothetical protein H257_17518 [Aphanomyces astaci]
MPPRPEMHENHASRPENVTDADPGVAANEQNVRCHVVAMAPKFMDHPRRNGGARLLQTPKMPPGPKQL